MTAETRKPEPTAASVEALAASWASIDGKGKEFEAGKDKPVDNLFGGFYAGYIADAEEMIERLRKRGFDVVEIKTATVVSMVDKSAQYNKMILDRVRGVPAQKDDGSSPNNSGSEP